MNNIVVYGWFANEELFYVGIGKPDRPFSMKSRNLYCMNKKLKAESEKSFEIRVLHIEKSWEQACEIECQLIQQYGRLDIGTGCLTNMTNGGDGTTGRKCSKKTRDKLSKSCSKENHYNWRKTLKQETKDKIGKAHKGKTVNQKTRERLKQALEGNTNSSTPVQTPEGRFDSVNDACGYYRVARSTLRRWLNDPNKLGFYKC